MVLLGALAGDYIGSRFQEDKCQKSNFRLFHKDCHFTDDSILTCAVAKTIIENSPLIYDEKHIKIFKKDLVNNFIKYFHKYPDLEYGERFRNWIYSEDHLPYGSWGNGAAMRISPVGWYASSIEEVKILSKIVSEVTHNTKEAIKGAEAIASCIFLSRKLHEKKDIKDYIVKNYYEELLFLEYDDLINNYYFDDSSDGSVPVAIMCFLESDNFADAIRKAVCIGGDSDTLCSMTGAIAEAYYGTDTDASKIIYKYINEYEPEEFKTIVNDFSKICIMRNK